MKRIAALESLRGLLALWVVLTHVIRHSGFSPADLGHFRLLASGGYAVDVFIILSGFVIFYLLDTQRLGYRHFIFRRFFRLAPLFFVVVVIAIPLQDWQLDQLQSLPWQSEQLESSIVIRQDTIGNMAAHIIAHATLLHGLLSDAILPSSEYAFVGQAWSISVEWQFYLVAPFLFWLVMSRRWQALAAVVMTICVIRFTNYGGEGFSIRQAGFFLTGILSFYLYKRIERLRIDARAIDAMAVIASAAAYMFLIHSIPLIIWGVVFALLIANRQEARTLPQRMGLAVLQHSWLQWLGRVSYSIYMVHGLVIFAAAAAIFYFDPKIGQVTFLFTLLAWSMIGSLGVSAFTFYFVEKPGIALGQMTTQSRVVTPRRPV